MSKWSKKLQTDEPTYGHTHLQLRNDWNAHVHVTAGLKRKKLRCELKRTNTKLVTAWVKVKRGRNRIFYSSHNSNVSLKSKAGKQKESHKKMKPQMSNGLRNEA